MNSNLPLVSVIITTKNEEKNIANCLSSILRQTYFCDKIEIIVVDNNSTDKTKEIVESHKVIKSKVHNVNESVFDSDFRHYGHSTLRTNPDIRLFSHGPERSAQRNFGVAQSKGEYFLYLDADMILSPEVIKDCVNEFIKSESHKVHKENASSIRNSPLERGNGCVDDVGLASNLRTFDSINFTNFRLDVLVGLYIPEIIMGKSFWCRVRRFERSFYDGTVIDCVRFIRKDKFLEVGGFDESMSGPEDWDLDRKIRQVGKTALIASPIYHNEAEFNLKKYLNKKGYYTKSFSAYVSKWGSDDLEIKKQLGFYYRFIGVFIENGKWKKLIAHPILTFGMYFLRFLVGMKYLARKS